MLDARLLLISLAVVQLLACAGTSQHNKDHHDKDDEEDDNTLWDSPEHAEPQFKSDLWSVVNGCDDDPDDVEEMSDEQFMRRIKVILDDIDHDDDGDIEAEDIERWVTESVSALRDEETADDFEDMDDDEDNAVSWKEFLYHEYFLTDENKATGEEKEEIEDLKELFDHADKNDDGELDEKEFIEFSQPDESEHLMPLLVKQALEREDTNGDGKLTLEEFRDNDGDKDDDDDEYREFIGHDDNDDKIIDEKEMEDWIRHDYGAEVYDMIQDLRNGSDDNDDGTMNMHELLEEPHLLRRSLIAEIGIQLQKIGKLGGTKHHQHNKKSDKTEL